MRTIVDSPSPSLEMDHPTLDLLMLGYPVAESGRLMAILRDNGQMVRLQRTHPGKDLSSILKAHPVQVALLNLDNRDLNPAGVIERLRAATPPPSIILTSHTPSAHVDAAARWGVQDLVDGGDYRRMALAVRRDYQASRLKQQLADLENRLAAEKLRFEELFQASGEATAYLSEGVIVEANTACCDLFGLDAADKGSLSILDLVTRQDRLNLKAALKRTATRKDCRESIRCRRQDGCEFDADLELAASHYGGERFVRLIVRKHAIDIESAVGIDRCPGPGEARHSFRVCDAPLESGHGEILAAANTFAEDRLCACYQPIVNLTGETTANYRVSLGLAEDSGTQWTHDELVQQVRVAGRITAVDRRLVHQALGELPHLDPRAGLQFQLSLESIRDEALLPWICESLRHYRVKGSRLYFSFDATQLRHKHSDLPRFIEGLKRINCRIACTGVTCDPGALPLLSDYGADIAQLADSVVTGLQEESETATSLAAFNLELQQKGIRTQAGDIGDTRTLKRMWNLGINAVWGDLLHPPGPLTRTH